MMRILHTADWHIGKIVNEFSMLEEQAIVLHELVDKVKELNVDVLIMAGDLYDRAIPPKEAVVLATQIFTRLIQEAGITVLAIAGNHDSNERLEYGAELLSASNLHIEGTVKEKVRKVTIKDTHFYLLPYADHVTIRKLLDNEEIKDLEDATRIQLDSIKQEMNPEETNVLIAHGYVVNHSPDTVEASDSERPLSIGTAEYVDATLFEGFDYVALGHLHKAQKVKTEKIRYSGSPLKYSKSEANHKKQFLLVDLSKDTLEIESLPILPNRELRVVRGTFEELMQSESEDYLFFELEDESYVMDAMNQLRRRYPYAMGLEYVGQRKQEREQKQQTQEKMQKRSFIELFEDFYQEYREHPLDEKQKEIITQVMQQVEKGEE
jgi:exonuclease SbcD